MKKFTRVLVLCFFVLFCFIFSSFAKTKKSTNHSKRFSITAESAILVDLNKNKILYAKNIHSKLAPASTLKILTALVAFEKLGANTEVAVSRNASNVEPSKSGLKKGTAYNSLDLINAVLISSSNDASIALAEAAAGSEDEFAQLMNQKAKSLGAKNSNFLNSSGLPCQNQYSSAYDLYRITKSALANPIIYEIMKKKKEKFWGNSGDCITLYNHNKLLFRKSYPLVLGKTGYTRNARHCYSGVAYFNGRRYAVVILKSQKPWDDIERLLKLARE